MKSALVTGSDGFIGRHVVAELERRGWFVDGIDLRGRVWNVWSGDARNFFQTDENRYNLVVHCAAHVGGRVDIDRRPTYLASVNIQLDGGLFEYALRTRPDRVVYWSSSAAYPIELQDGLTLLSLEERDVNLDVPRLPDASYGAVKLAGENLARWARAEGLRVHVLRPFSGYGEDQDTTYPFPRFIQRARNRDDPFEIWGPGTQVRDFVHVDDVVGCMFAALEQDYDRPLNVCTGVPTSFNELAEQICTTAGYAPSFHRVSDAPTGVLRRVGDPTEMLKIYRPQVSLTEGVARALA